MPALIPDPLPAEVETLLEHRRERGADRHDEVWEGVLHMSPPPSMRHELIVDQVREVLRPLAKQAGMVVVGAAGIGVQDDHRVPDLTLLRPPLQPQWQPTGALVVEVLSWRDSAWLKLDFYATHHVDEIVIVDPDQHKIDWLALLEGSYQPVERSTVMDHGHSELASRIEWGSPPIES